MYASNKENIVPATNLSQDAFRSSIPKKLSKRSAALQDSSAAADCVDESLEARLQKALKEIEQLKQEKEELRAQVQSWKAITDSKNKALQEKDLLLSKKENEIDWHMQF
ncbi:predicted protein [Chaetoceros tenuissimus]|uniref:Uncharacterized protein n=1 Tax=Chaetoceros tenuissimus TaxID=426638 RepID=A0AAD3HAX0_9STRA|nr:predicted protein [Chaetoceros tenuissimus]